MWFTGGGSLSRGRRELGVTSGPEEHCINQRRFVYTQQYGMGPWKSDSYPLDNSSN